MIKFKRVANRISINIFGIKMAFMIEPRKTNYYIGLGTSCYPRKMLRKVGLKASKKNGELSCPFDLCYTPVKAVAEHLENNFKDFFEDIQFVHDTKYCSENFNTEDFYRSEKFQMDFIHDNMLNREEFNLRYKNRINNFLELSKNKDELVYFLAAFDNCFENEHIESIYNSIKRLRNGKKFTIFVASFVDVKGLKQIIPHEELVFKEYTPRCSAHDYITDWFLVGDKSCNEIFDDVVKDMENL